MMPGQKKKKIERNKPLGAFTGSVSVDWIHREHMIVSNRLWDTEHYPQIQELPGVFMFPIHPKCFLLLFHGH